MNKSLFQQAMYRWLVGLLVFSAAVSAWLTIPRVASANPNDSSVGPNIYMPAAHKEACATLKSAGIGGFQVYGGANFGSPYYKDLIESGASWVRLGISWSAVEPENTTPANYAWSHTDTVAKLASEQCWPVIFMLSGNPGWASTLPEGPLDKTSLDELEEFMGALAERYDGDGIDDAPGSPIVLYFEMYNEPDAGASGANERWGLYGDLYASMLKAVYPAVKQANPKAQVVFGGIAFDFFTDSPQPGPFVRHFFDDVLDSGGGAYFDVMNYHFYPLFGWNWTKQYPKDGPGLVEKAEAVRAVMRKYNVDKPLIITETAWHNNGNVPYGSNTVQIRMLQQLYTQAKAAGVPMVAWWPLEDPGGSYPYNSGLVTNGQAGAVTRKPAYTAYQVYMRELDAARFVAEVSAEGDVKVYELRDDARNRTIYVAWTNPTDLATVWGSPTVPYKDTTRTTEVALSGESAIVHDAYWDQVATVSDADDGKRDGKVTVTINGDPKYVVIGG
jgi:hypothetical protein